MKNDITIILKEEITDSVLEKYYNQLWSAVREQYGIEMLIEIYEELKKDKE